jgi:hypothetical protein
MGLTSESFDLHATLHSIGQAALAVTGHMLFKFGVHGLFMAAFMAIAGLVLVRKNPTLHKALLLVARRIAVFCAVISLPGIMCLIFYGKLPDAGVFNINSMGFICLWSLICVHLFAEEVYHGQLKGQPARDGK